LLVADGVDDLLIITSAVDIVQPDQCRVCRRAKTIRP